MGGENWAVTCTSVLILREAAWQLCLHFHLHFHRHCANFREISPDVYIFTSVDICDFEDIYIFKTYI